MSENGQLNALADTRITLLGCGRMGFALLSGWIRSGVDGRLVQVIEPTPSDELQDFAARHGVRICEVASADAADVVVVALKPQAVAEVARDCRDLFAPDSLILSIMAGVKLAQLASMFSHDGSAVRTMPNLPAMVGAGMTVLVTDSDCRSEHRAAAESLMRAVGSTLWLPEEEMVDAACAVSGSGPAYVFLLVESLARAGASEGLPADIAAQLARMTIVGAGSLLGPAGTDPAELRRQVTSPGGTTEAGLRELTAGDALDRLARSAVAAAAERSRELGA